MKPLHFITVFVVAIFLRHVAAEVFVIPDYGFSIEMPNGWMHDAEDQFGFVIYDPSSPYKVRKIRIHKPSGEAKTLEDQVSLSLATINKRREGKHPAEIIRCQNEVISKSGIHGYMVAHGVKPSEGFTDESNKPYINHYYFMTPSGQIICVCAYLTGADKETEARIESQILNTLKLLPTKNKKG
jgi:hypothetical protein